SLNLCVDFLAWFILGFPQDIYNLVNHNEHAKQIWDRVKLLIQGSELSLQEHESKLYDDFDMFTSLPGESIHSYYMWFAQLINDMHTIGMTMQPLQVNTKFVNHLQHEWSKFVTDVKLEKDMHSTNFDHLYAQLRQHEAYANEVSLTRQRYPDQIDLVANSPSCLTRLRLAVPSFNPSDDPIASLNKQLFKMEESPFRQFRGDTQGYANIKARSNATSQGVNKNGGVNTIDDLDAFDSNCDDPPSAKAVLMENLSSYDSNVISEVSFHDTNIENDMSYRSVQETQCSEQLSFDNDTKVDITSDSNIIYYAQYLKKTENPVVQDTSSPAQQDELLMSVIKEMSSQVAKCNKVQHENKIINETLTAELERYKEQVKIFEQRQTFILNDREKNIDGQLRHVIVDRNAKVTDFEKQIHSLKLQLNATVKRAFEKDVKPFAQTLKEYFHMFEHGLYKELKDMKAIFNQMETKVAKRSIDKKYFEIEKNELSLDNDRLLKHIICQDVMNVVMHVNVHSHNVLHANNNSLEHDNSAYALKVGFAESSDTSKDKTRKQAKPQAKQTTNNSVSPSIGVSNSTEASGSKPQSNTKIDMNTQTSICNANVKHSILNANSKLICATCHECRTNNTLVPGLGLLQAYDREALSAPQLSSKTKSWLWHRQLSYLNFDTLNQLAKQGLVRGLPNPRFEKDYLCSACSLGKSKFSHKPKADDTNQEKLYLLHMDLCGLMRAESINGKKYILVIIDDYSRFTWGKFLRSKDETPEVIIKCLKKIQVRLNATVRNIQTDNGTEFVNYTQAVSTTCYTQNHSLIRLRYNKTPYELMHAKKPDLSFLYVFDSLCYPINYSEDLGKLKLKADICIFIGYALAKKAYRIYNKRNREIMETIHVTFDELTTMASEQFSSGPAP
ncbi:retrovirus-related pol polyprotein from transposon TNT 1-94, partial [Tanacetum coccineum]